jgi:CheY-like chemotaxis protein
VIEATTCAEALAKARIAGIDAIVLDRRLPDGDGMDVCRTLRSDPKTRALPIIVLSGREKQDAIEADVYLLKPVVPDVLVGELERLIARD